MSARWMIAAWCFVGCFPDPPVADVSDGDDVADSAPGDDGADGGAEADGATPDVADTLAEAEVADTLAEAEVADTTEIADTTEVADTTGNTEDASTVPDTELADTVADTADAAPDSLDDTSVVDADVSPCPAGCEHLDDACHTGVCGPLGCESIELTGPCDDDDPCTLDDRCEAGACIGDEVVCEALDTCHIAGVCDPDTGVCSSPAKLDTSPCDDGDACTEDEGCAAGVCKGGHVPDDSRDWHISATRLDPAYVVADDSGFWWFVSLRQSNTSFGISPSGQPIALTLPGGSVTGIGAVELDRDGRPVTAVLLASSTSETALMPLGLSPPRVISFGGESNLLAVLSFTGEVTFKSGGADVITEGDSVLRYIVAAFRRDGSLLRKTLIENPAFRAFSDLKAVSFPGVGFAPTGETIVSIPVGPDALVSVGTAQYRGPVGVTYATFVVGLGSLGQIAWQRELLGTSPVLSLGLANRAWFDSHGQPWIAGVCAESCDWRRTDGSVVSSTSSLNEEMLLFSARIDSGGALEPKLSVAATFGSTILQSTTSYDSSRATLSLACTGPCAALFDASRMPITETPLGGLGIGLVEATVVGDETRVFSAPSNNLSRIAYGADDLIIILAGAGRLEDGGGAIVANTDSEGTLTLVGLPWSSPNAPWTYQLSQPEEPASSGSIADFTIIPSGPGHVIGGRIGPVDQMLATSLTPTLGADTSFVALLNSEGGKVCLER